VAKVGDILRGATLLFTEFSGLQDWQCLSYFLRKGHLFTFAPRSRDA
jgi:hypothetical protein